jgi:DNA-binding NarL/FixJ family response regulator
VVGTGGTSTTKPETTRARRVVIVDDDDDVRLLLRVTLQRDPRFEVVGEAVDGYDAIETIAEAQPDLVVLDLAMPRLGGVEALPEIKRRSPGAIVVLYTARPDVGAHEAGLVAGATAVVEKSVIGTDLLDRLAGALG